MIYYDDGKVLVRNMEKEDAQQFVDGEVAQGWDADIKKYEMRLADQKAGKAVALTAEYQGKAAGYINVYPNAENGAFGGMGYPEIVDFGVLEKYRRAGIGNRLMDIAEEIAGQYADTVYLGVGLHSGYGSAQRMYVKRGYIPDGSGVWYRDVVCGQNADCRNDDDLVLYLSKKLRTAGENTPTLETERLILRKFTEKDMEALYQIYSDREVNRFLPWFPLKSRAEAQAFYAERYAAKYAQPRAYAYAVCLKTDNSPIGYINVGTEKPYDLGYGLRKEFWHQGIATEAVKAVIAQAKKDGIPYITATHDRNNPHSGRVMENAGMKYQYSYEEQWQPKDITVIFRMYQINLNCGEELVYRKYWDTSTVHFVERIWGRQNQADICRCNFR